MRCFVYSDKAIITGAKRASRLIALNTIPIDVIRLWEGDLLNMGLISKNVKKVQSISKNKKIYLLNREPLGHIKSGLVNIFEKANSGVHSPFESDMVRLNNSALQHTWVNLIYISANKDNFENNFKTNKLKDDISEDELLNLLNWFVDLYNNKLDDFYLYFMADVHTSPKQHLIKQMKDSIDCEVVDIEEHDNLLKYIGFNWSGEDNNAKKSKYSQKEPKLFFDILLDYILTQDKNIVANHFKSIYGKSSIVRGSTLSNIEKNDKILEVLNNEIKIYNELK